MKKTTAVVSVVGAVAMAACVLAQAPGPQGPGEPSFRGQMRQRMQQRMGGPFQGGPGMQGLMPGHGMAMRGGPGLGGPGGAGRGDILKRVLGNPELAKKAGVTDEQIARIKDGQIAFEKQMIQMRADAEQARLDVKQLMQSDKPDRTAISKAIDNAAAKEVTLRKAGVMRMLDVKETLGQEAIARIKTMTREHMQQRMQQGPRGPGAMQRPGPQGGARPWQQGPANPPPPGAPGV